MNQILSAGFPVFVNQVLLECSHLHMVYDCFCNTMAKLSSQNKGCLATEPKIFIILLFTEKASQPLIYIDTTFLMK